MQEKLQVVSSRRIANVINALSVISIGEYDAGEIRIPVEEQDDFGLLEEMLNLFAQEHAETTRKNVDYLRAVEEARREAAAQELRETQLKEQLTRAQLHTLRMQLQPHFLFNTLNSIAALVEYDVRAAQSMIVRLSDFFRMTLVNANHQEIPLRVELALLEHYVEIERMRFADRLQVQFDIDPELLDRMVPSLILQPLVENAVRHGIQPSLHGGTVVIRAKREGARMELEVMDDGVGIPLNFDVRSVRGVGMANARQRIQQLYGHLLGSGMEVERAVPSGTRVTLRIPMQECGGEGR